MEYLKYKDIALCLEARAEPRFHNLRATVTLEYVKGQKAELNESLVKYLRPLDDIQSIYVCPIALLLVHALRNGLINGTTLDEVLSHTATQPDLRVKWTHLDRLVLTATSLKPERCDLDHVISAQHVNIAVKVMGLTAGILSRVHSHALRYGALRDYGHLPKAVLAQTADIEDVRRLAGHHHKTMMTGLTEKYVSDLAIETYNARARNGGVNHR